MTTTTPAQKFDKWNRTTKEILGEEAEMAIASQDFIFFLDYVKVLSRPQPRLGIPGGPSPFQKWPHVLEFAQALMDYDHIAVFKTKQAGFSTTITAYAVWQFLFHHGANILNFSSGQSEANALLSKARYVYKHLPGSWIKTLDIDSRTEMVLNEKESRIVAFPSTQDAGIGETATLAVQDERDFHEFQDLNFANVQPTIERVKGQIVLGSTPDKTKGLTGFRQIVKGAPENGWHLLVWPWTVVGERDQAWWDETFRTVPTTEKMSPELYMEQNYWSTLSEGLAPARTQSAFDHDALKGMEQDQKRVVEKIGLFAVYQRAKLGHRYVCGTDSSHGVGLDHAVSVILDPETGYVCADLMEKTVSPEELAVQTYKVLQTYEDFLWGIEDNEWGVLVVRAALDAGCPPAKIFHRKSSRNVRKIGWHTDSKSRYVLWGELIEAVNAGHITIPNPLGVAQMYQVIRNSDQDGRIEAQIGGHDDYATALGIAWQMRKHIRSRFTSLAKVTSV
jgi:hypothetical protein